MTGCTDRHEAANPIWVLLGANRDSEAVLWVAPENGEWDQSLRRAVSGLDGDQRLIVSVPRPLARWALQILARRSPRRPEGPGPAAIRRVLDDLGMVVEHSYTLWPSAASPRLANPHANRRAFYWLQRSGVLGGGGQRLWARALARSLLFTPLAVVLAPGIALVAQPAKGGDRSS